VYENKKMISVETIPGIGGGEMKKSSGGVNSSMVCLIHCKNLSKYYNVPPSCITTRIGDMHFL
jgi:hypothetical protein